MVPGAGGAPWEGFLPRQVVGLGTWAPTDGQVLQIGVRSWVLAWEPAGAQLMWENPAGFRLAGPSAGPSACRALGLWGGCADRGSSGFSSADTAARGTLTQLSWEVVGEGNCAREGVRVRV